MQVLHYMTANFRVAATQFMIISEPDQAEQNDALLRLIYGQGLGAVFWKHHSARLAGTIGEFRAHVDALLAKDR
jgi:hypothetical protein